MFFGKEKEGKMSVVFLDIREKSCGEIFKYNGLGMDLHFTWCL